VCESMYDQTAKTTNTYTLAEVFVGSAERAPAFNGAWVHYLVKMADECSDNAEPTNANSMHFTRLKTTIYVAVIT